MRASAALRGILCAWSLALCGPAIAAAHPASTYGRELLDQVRHAHPDILIAAIGAIPPKSTQALTLASGGSAKLAASVATATTSTVSTSGDRVEVQLPLRDVSGDSIGTLSLTYAYRAGADRAAIEHGAEGIRDWLGRRVSHAGNLFDPYPYELDAPAHVYAQTLVDEFVLAHPEIEIFAIHATAPDSDYNVIAGSNIGRIGKKADNDDMRCVYTGKPNLEVNSTGKRFESEMQLHDRSGQVIGAVGVVVAYKAGDDKEALHAHAEQIRAELEQKIPDAASLFRPAPGGNDPVLVLKGRTELPTYSGDFDHFAVDVASNRLFLAAEDHGTLEVFELRSGRHLKTIKGFETPHSIFPIVQTHKLLITDGSDAIKLLDAQTLAPAGTIQLHPGADSIGFDSGSGHLYVVTGGKDVKMKESWLEEIDPVTTKKVSEVHFDADHVEAMAVEQHGSHIYINVTDKNELDVIDKATHQITARWPIHEAEQNALAQLDEAAHRLFIVARKPGTFIVLNAETGASLASFEAPGHVDAEIYDDANHRVYAPGGDGYIGVYGEQGGEHFAELAHVPSAAGAKTAILVPELHRLYVAVSPGEGKTGGAILWFDVKASQGS